MIFQTMKTMEADKDNDDFLDTVNLPTKTLKADKDNDAGGTSLAYARADDHLPLVVTDISGDFVIQIKRDNIKNYQNW